MARLIVNKFFDKHEDAIKGFTTDNNYMFGEIVICNDSNNPCIYIKDNDQLSRGIGQISVKTDDNILTKTKNGVISASLSLTWDRITNSIQLLGKDQKVISSISVFDDNDDSVSDAIVNNIQRVIDVVYNNEDSKLIFTTFKNGETKTIEVKLDIEGKDYVSVDKIDDTYVISIDTETNDGIATKKWVADYYDGEFNDINEKIEQLSEFDNRITEQLEEKVDITVYETNIEEINKQIENNNKTIDEKLDSAIYEDFHNEYMKVKEQVDYFFDLKYDEEEEGEGEEDESKIDTLKEIVDWISGADGETIGDLAKEIKENKAAIDSHTQQINDINKALEDTIDKDTYENDKTNFNKLLQNKIDVSTYRVDKDALHKKIDDEISIREATDNEINQTLTNKVNIDEYDSYKESVNQALNKKVNIEDYNISIAQINKDITQNAAAIETLQEADSNFTNTINDMQTTISGHTGQISQINTSLDGKVDNTIYQFDKAGIEKSISDNTKLIDTKVDKGVYDELLKQYNATKQEVDYFFNDNAEIDKTVDTLKEIAHWLESEEGETASDLATKIAANAKAIETLQATDNEINQTLTNKVNIDEYDSYKESVNQALNKKVNTSDYNSSITEINESIQKTNDEIENVFEQLDTKIDSDEYASKMLEIEELIETKVSNLDFSNEITKLNNSISGNTKLISDNTEAIAQLKETDTDIYEKLNDKVEETTFYSFYNDYIADKLKWDNFLGGTSGGGNDISVDGLNKAIDELRDADSNITNTINGMQTTINGHTEQISQINISLNDKVDISTYGRDKNDIEKSISGNTKLISDNAKAIENLQTADNEINISLLTKVDKNEYNDFYEDYVETKSKLEGFLGGNPDDGSGSLDSLLKLITQNKTDIENLQVVDTEFATQVGSIEGTISEHTSQLADINTSLGKKVDNEEYNAKVEELNKSIGENKTAIEANATAFNAALGEKVDNEEYNAKVAELNTALGRKVDNEEYNTKVAELNKSIETNKTAIEANETAFNAALGEKVDNEEYNAKVAELNTALDGKVDNEEYNAKVAGFEKSIGDNSNNINLLIAEDKKIIKRLDEMQLIVDQNGTTEEGHYIPSSATTINEGGSQTVKFGDTIKIPVYSFDSRGHYVETAGDNVLSLTFPDAPVVYDYELNVKKDNYSNISLEFKKDNNTLKNIDLKGEQNITILTNDDENQIIFKGPDLTDYVTTKDFVDGLEEKADTEHNQNSSTITDAIKSSTGITSTAEALVQGKAVYEYAAEKGHGHDDYYSKDDVNKLLNKKADTEHSQNSSTITDAITTGTGITSGATELVQGNAVYEYAAEKEHWHGDTYAAKEHGHGKISFDGDVTGDGDIEHNGCKVSLTVTNGEHHTHVSSGITDAITTGTGITSGATELVQGNAVYEYAAEKEHWHGDTYAAKEHGHGNIILKGGVTGEGKISGDNNIEISTTVVPSEHTHKTLKILQNGANWKTYNGSEDVEINLVTSENGNGSNVNVSASLTSGYEIAKITVDSDVHTLYGKEALPLTGGTLEAKTTDTPLTLKSTYKDNSCWLAFQEKDGWTLSIGTNCSKDANSNNKSLMLYDGTNTRTILDDGNHSESKHLPNGATNNQFLSYDGETNTPIWTDITNIVNVSASINELAGDGAPSVTATLTGKTSNKTLVFHFNNLRGYDGYGIYYYKKDLPNNGSMSIQNEDIITNERDVQVGDLILTKNSHIFRVKTVKPTITVEYVLSLSETTVTPGTSTTITGATATVDPNVGEPSVNVTTTGTDLHFEFYNLKGEKGSNGSNGYSMYYTTTEYASTVTSIPQSNVITNGRTLQIGDMIVSKNGNVFKISNVATNLTVAYVFSLKGGNGTSASIIGATATVDSNTGTPSVTVTPTGTELKRGFNFDFKNLKGDNGDPGADGRSVKEVVCVTTNGGTEEGTPSTAASITNYYRVKDTNNSFLGGTIAVTNGADGKDGASASITGATATVNSNTGTPSVTVTTIGTDLKRGFEFDFKNLKGEPGTSGSNGYSMYYTPTEYSTGQTSIPQSKVTTNNRALQVGDLIISANGNVFKISKVATNLTVAYVFSLKGGNGTSASITGATATVDSNTGTPEVTVSATGTDLKRGFKFDFKNLKGDNGDPGDDGRSVKEVVCVKSSSSTETTTPSTADGGTSYYKIKDTNGNWLEGTIAVKNGSKGSNDDATTVTDENVKSTVDDINKGYLLASTESGTTTGTTIKNSNHYISGDTLYVGNLESNNEVYGVKGYFTEELEVEGNIIISNNGIVSGATAYYQTSDERMKEFGDDIEIDFEKLKEIPKKYFTWKSDDSKKLDIGTSAQKVRELYPEIVGGSDDTILSVDYAKLSIIALKAVDKLHEENEMLRTELDMIKKHLGL